jgi:hypothetical protein
MLERLVGEDSAAASSPRPAARYALAPDPCGIQASKLAIECSAGYDEIVGNGPLQTRDRVQGLPASECGMSIRGIGRDEQG